MRLGDTDCTASRRKAKALRHAVSPPVRRRSLAVALVVGTLLTVVNQGDSLLAGEGLDWVKAALTYAIPYCVATYGAYTSARSQP